MLRGKALSLGSLCTTDPGKGISTDTDRQDFKVGLKILGSHGMELETLAPALRKEGENSDGVMHQGAKTATAVGLPASGHCLQIPGQPMMIDGFYSQNGRGPIVKDFRI